MLISNLLLFAAIAGTDAFYLAERVAPHLQRKDTTYQGGWPLFTEAACPQDYPEACGSSTTVIQSCCPSGNTCFGGLAPYCCPTSQDCRTFVTTFPVCVDPSANMFMGNFGVFFCCKNGLTGVIPSDNQGLCQEAGGPAVPVSRLATMTSQNGGTSVTPFGGFGTATGSAATSAVASATNTAARSKITSGAATATAGNAAATSSVAAASPSKSGWNPGNGAIAGLAIAAAFLLGLIYIVWSRLSKRKARKEAFRNNSSYGGNTNYSPAATYGPTANNGRSSYVHQYMPPPAQNTAPAGPPPGWAYDPVNERVTSVSPMSPRTPLSPAPAYKAVDAHEMSSRLEVAEVPAQSGRRQGSMTGRVEMG